MDKVRKASKTQYHPCLNETRLPITHESPLSASPSSSLSQPTPLKSPLPPPLLSYTVSRDMSRARDRDKRR